jgi:tetratricopeptide (TPR) repeat protein
MNDENRGPIEGDLADSIAMLEQILEVMPQDVIALKALYNAYVQADRRGSAFVYLERLTEALVDADEPEVVEFVRVQLMRYEESDAEKVAALRKQLRCDTGDVLAGAGMLRVSGAAADADAVLPERDINEELALAWRLYEEGQLSQEEYSSVLHDLTEMSSKTVEVPVSVLHVLNDRGFTQMNRILNYMSANSGVPYLNLSYFEVDKKAVELLPEAIYFRDGALPFALFGDDLLLAVLNPYHTRQVDTLSRMSKRRCHTFLVGPEEYDEALKLLRA